MDKINLDERGRTRRAAFFLDACQRRYEAGDASALAAAIYWAAGLHVPLPLWATYAYQKAYLEKPGSWNDVLGPLRGRGAQKSPDRGELMWQVWERVRQERESSGESNLLNDGLFSDVARKLGLSEDESARVRHLYYEAVHWCRDLLAMIGETAENPQQKDQTTK
jgi:hypothetical protein